MLSIALLGLFGATLVYGHYGSTLMRAHDFQAIAKPEALCEGTEAHSLIKSKHLVLLT